MEDARGKARECVGGERLHAYASCMPWANNSYEVSPVSRDMHGTESCYTTTFRKFHAILNHANYAARPAQGKRERERIRIRRFNGISFPGTSGYSRHGSAYEKSLPRSLFAASYFHPRRSPRKRLTFHRGSIRGYIFVRGGAVYAFLA